MAGGIAYWVSGLRNWKRTDGFGPAGYVLTSNGESAEPTMQAGSGGGGITKVSIDLTNAELLALPSSYKQLVAAPAAGSMHVFHRAILIINSLAGAYGNVEPDEAKSGLTIGYGDWAVDASTFAPMPTTALKYVGHFAPYTKVPTVAMLTGLGSSPAYPYPPRTEASVNADGLALKLIAWNGEIFGGGSGLGNYTGGNAANSGRVILWYSTEVIP